MSPLITSATYMYYVHLHVGYYYCRDVIKYCMAVSKLGFVTANENKLDTKKMVGAT